ncbi:MAG: polysaccharide deacetylase family protein [Bauldia sp.]|nr:polysaccharide deacetylase family protein [Bauldia sp.]
MRLYHFSENGQIGRFIPRPVKVPAERAAAAKDRPGWERREMKRFIGVVVLAVAVAALVFLFGESTGSTNGSPPRLLAGIASAFPDAVFYRDTTEKVVALTVDDVPWAGDAGDAAMHLILDTIAEHNEGTADPALKVRATFFVISGQLADGSTILDRIRQQGHEIGNHGDADGTAAMLPANTFAQQLRASAERLAGFTNQPIRWYRPGRGLFTRAMVESLRGMQGYEPRFALASMLPIDTFRPADDPRFTAWYVRQHVFPGAILVLHGGSLRQSGQTAEALKMILSDLRQRGYRVVTLSELWGPG